MIGADRQWTSSNIWTSTPEMGPELAPRAVEVRRRPSFFEADLYGEVFRDPAERDRVQASLRKAGL